MAIAVVTETETDTGVVLNGDASGLRGVMQACYRVV
jgi:hypothetical protein